MDEVRGGRDGGLLLLAVPGLVVCWTADTVVTLDVTDDASLPEDPAPPNSSSNDGREDLEGRSGEACERSVFIASGGWREGENRVNRERGGERETERTALPGRGKREPHDSRVCRSGRGGDSSGGDSSGGGNGGGGLESVQKNGGEQQQKAISHIRSMSITTIDLFRLICIPPPPPPPPPPPRLYTTIHNYTQTAHT